CARPALVFCPRHRGFHRGLLYGGHLPAGLGGLSRIRGLWAAALLPAGVAASVFKRARARSGYTARIDAMPTNPARVWFQAPGHSPRATATAADRVGRHAARWPAGVAG